MNLLNITTRYFLLLLLVLLIPWTLWLYTSIRHGIYHHVDEFLDNRKFEIIQETTRDPALLHDSSRRKTDFTLQPITTGQIKTLRERYSDTQVFEPLEREMEPYRQLETAFRCDQGFYKLTIRASLTDTHYLLSSMLFKLGWLIVALLVLLVLLNRLILSKLWRPFYQALQQIRHYRLDRDTPLQFEETSVKEFTELSTALTQLMTHTRQMYGQQKQFTENASHEIQTPLAIARNQVELLSQDPALSTSQAQLLLGIEQNLNRLARLNKSLLLLAKIENHQFMDVQPLEVGQLIRALFEQLAEMVEYKGLEISVESPEPVFVSMNPDLAEVFFGNLIRNAVFHNLPDGYLHLVIRPAGLVIENSGPAYGQEPSRLFERFVKGSAASASQGLGLSLVHSIGNVYGFDIRYTIHQSVHRMEIIL